MRTYSFKAYKFVDFNIKRKLSGKNQESIPSSESADDLLGWSFTEKAILQMKYVSDLNRAEFVIVPITEGNTQQFEILKGLASHYNLSFIDTQSMDNVDSFYLPHDGHFSEEGARAMAEIVAKYLKDKNLLKNM